MPRSWMIRKLGGIVRDPASNSECQHVWSNWSEPGATRVVQTRGWVDGSVERDGWAQDRHCLKCNQYERRLA